jgi:phage regulator Rha-like protein
MSELIISYGGIPATWSRYIALNFRIPHAKLIEIIQQIVCSDTESDNILMPIKGPNGKVSEFYVSKDGFVLICEAVRKKKDVSKNVFDGFLKKFDSFNNLSTGKVVEDPYPLIEPYIFVLSMLNEQRIN